LAFSFSLGAVLFFVLVMEAAVALAVVVLHLFVSKHIWSLASQAREKASGKPLPKLFKQEESIRSSVSSNGKCAVKQVQRSIQV